MAATACALLFVGVVLLNRHAVTSCRLGDGVSSVILGDSHTAWAIDDAAVPGVRNVSLNAEGYKYTYLKLQHLMRSEPQVKRVYLALSYANLSAYYDDYVTGSTFRFFAARYVGVLSAKDYVELFRNSPRTAPNLFERLLRDGLSAAIRQNCTLYGNFFSNPDDHRFETFDFEVMEQRIAEQYYTHFGLQAQSKQNLDYLEKIIGLVREHGVELVTLNTPLHPEYQKRIPAAFRQLYEHTLERHRLTNFDFADLGLGDGDFLPDGDHTNYAGAMRTTRRFAEYHNAHPVLSSTSP